MEELFDSQHKNENMQMRHTRRVAIINYFSCIPLTLPLTFNSREHPTDIIMV